MVGVQYLLAYDCRPERNMVSAVLSNPRLLRKCDIELPKWCPTEWYSWGKNEYKGIK